MKPILKYPGAKWRIAPWILEHIPPHESYLEPYFGSGAVLFNKAPARIETINDLDGEVVNFFRICREHPEELADALSLTPWSREEYDAADPWGCDGDGIERARQFAICCWMGIGSGLRGSNGWRHTTGRSENGGPDNPKSWKRLPGLVQQVAARLQQVQIENRPAVEVIKAFRGDNVLIYADPPYMKSTRTNGYQYHCEMADDEHVELLKVLTGHPGPVLISGYDSDLYNAYLPGWRKVTRKSLAERGATRTEILWMNFEHQIRLYL